MLGSAISAFERDGLALVLVASRDRSVLDTNAVLARLTGHPDAMIRERGLGLFAAPDADPAVLTALDAAIADGSELRGELSWARADGSRFWFGFTVIPVGEVSGAGPAVLFMGRDISDRRRRAREETTIQAVLALVFRSIDVAAAVILPDDRILVANPAYAALTGFALRELDGMSVDRLTAPASREQARSLRAEQRRTGETYRMPLALRRKDGSVVQILLHAVAVEYEGTRFRVVTLREDRAPGPAAAPPGPMVVGRVALVRLDALREACGERWPQVQTRLMMLAESVLKRRLGRDDVYARTAEGGFAIWFARGGEVENADRIAAITREIRIRLIGEIGDETTPGVTGLAVTVEAEGIDTPPDAETLAATLMQRLAARQAALRAELAAELEAALAAPPTVEERLVGVGGGAGLVWIALAPELDRRIEAARALAGDDQDSVPDPALVLLGAVGEQALSALAHGDRTPRAARLGYEIFAHAARRRGLLAACRALPPGVREVLIPVLDGIPPGVNPQRLLEVGQELAPLFATLGLAAEAPALPPLPQGLLPFGLVVFDAPALRALSEQRLARLFAEARTHRLRVAVRQAGAQAQRLARLGAQFLGVAA